MATLNHGILTNAGRNLFNSVIQGNSKITYTKVIFCDDKELLNMSDDEIQDLTQINVNNSLETQPVSYNEGLLQGQNGEQASEVVVRAIVSNAGSKDDSGNVIQPPLTNGFYPYVSALYASDGTNEILYGLYLKDQPGYMPAYDGHTPQPLQFTWRLYAATVDNFNLSDTKDIYATINDLNNINTKYQFIAKQIDINSHTEIKNAFNQADSNSNQRYNNAIQSINSLTKPNLINSDGFWHSKHLSNEDKAFFFYVNWKNYTTYHLSFNAYADSPFNLSIFNSEINAFSATNVGTSPQHYDFTFTTPDSVHQLGIGEYDNKPHVLHLQDVCLTHTNDKIPYITAQDNRNNIAALPSIIKPIQLAGIDLNLVTKPGYYFGDTGDNSNTPDQLFTLRVEAQPSIISQTLRACSYSSGCALYIRNLYNFDDNMHPHDANPWQLIGGGKQGPTDI